MLCFPLPKRFIGAPPLRFGGWELANYRPGGTRRGRGSRSGRITRQRCEGGGGALGFFPLSRAAALTPKTPKVVRFQSAARWRQPCMIPWCPAQLARVSALRSHFNSVRKVREVSGQSVAHLYWSATCCSARTQARTHTGKGPETQSTTALYWPQAAWRPAWSARHDHGSLVREHSLENLWKSRTRPLLAFSCYSLGFQPVF